MNVAVEAGMNGDQNPIILMSQNNDEKNNYDDENDHYLEEMLAKAARLANEMKEISTKQSTTTSSKSSMGKDGVRRSLPKVINVQPSDDHTARSECSSLGYSLATTTPSIFVVKDGKSNPTTTPSTMNLLSTTIEDCAEGYFLKSDPHSSSTTTNACSIINEGSINNDHDEKKSCSETVSDTKPSYHLHKLCNAENIPNMSSVDMLMQHQHLAPLHLQTPPKVKRTSHQPHDTSKKAPLVTTNPALQSTLLATKSFTEDMHDDDSALILPKVLPPYTQERPTVLKISHSDDDYVPIADYSIRNTTTKASNTTGSAVKWEKITAPTVHDDDYVSLKDYSRFPKIDNEMKNQSQLVTKQYNSTAGLSFAQKRELLIKRRRRRKRFMRRLATFGIFIISLLLYYGYTRNDWFQHQLTQLSLIANNMLLRLHTTTLPDNTDVTSPEERYEIAKTERMETEFMLSVVVESDNSFIDENIITIDNETLAELENPDEPLHELAPLNMDEEIIMSPSDSIVETNTAMTTVATAVTAINTTMTERLSFLEPKSRQRFVEDLINSMMQ
jgi:hypothetical protein